MNLTKERLLEAVDVLTDLQSAFSDLRMYDEEHDRNAAQAGILCAMASLHAVELAKHLADGLDFYDALRATVRGEMKLPESFSKEWSEAMARLNDPKRHN